MKKLLLLSILSLIIPFTVSAVTAVDVPLTRVGIGQQYVKYFDKLGVGTVNPLSELSVSSSSVSVVNEGILKVQDTNGNLYPQRVIGGSVTQPFLGNDTDTALYTDLNNNATGAVYLSAYDTTQGKAWGVASLDANAYNYFKGSTAIGGSTGIPGTVLDVAGSDSSNSHGILNVTNSNVLGIAGTFVGGAGGNIAVQLINGDGDQAGYFRNANGSAVNAVDIAKSDFGVDSAGPIRAIGVQDVTQMTVQPWSTQTTPIFRVTDRNITFSYLNVAGNGNVGIGTTSPYASLSVVGSSGVVADHYSATSTTATSTFANGISLSGGCVSVGGSCIGGGASLSGGINNTLTYWTGGSTVSATNSPTVGFIIATSTTRSIFPNASTTNLSVASNLYDVNALGGTPGQVLMSTVSGPIWYATTSVTNTSLTVGHPALVPVDAVNYYFGQRLNVVPISTAGGLNTAVDAIPVSGTIRAVGCEWGISATLGTNENVTYNFILYNSSGVFISTTTISSTVQLTTATGNFINTNLGLSVTGGQQFLIEMKSPTWATNPSAVYQKCTINIDSTGSVTGGTIQSGTTGQFPYYASNGNTLTATSSVFVNTNQNVGISSTSPTSALTVAGNAYIGTSIGVNRQPSAGYTATFQVGGTGGFLVTGSGIMGNYSNLVDADTVFSITASGSGRPLALIGPTVSADIGLQTSNTERLTVTSGGKVGIGTTSPYATLAVQSGASTGDAFVVATSTGNSIGGYDNDGHRFTSGPKGAISSCGTGSPTLTGDDQGGIITTGTAATSCTYTFAKIYQNSPYCVASDDSGAVTPSVSVTTSALTLGLGAGLSGGKIGFMCAYHK